MNGFGDFDNTSVIRRELSTATFISPWIREEVDELFPPALVEELSNQNLPGFLAGVRDNQNGGEGNART